jgi:transposase-like protein
MSRRRPGRPAPPLAPTPAERRALERWARGTEAPGLAERAKIVLACADGATRSEVARGLATSAHRVGRWCRRFSAAGLDGLLDDSRPGARPRIDEALRARVMARVGDGVVSTHGLARAFGISQPTASRLRRELSFDPIAATLLPTSLRAVDPATSRLAGLFVAAGQRVLLVFEASSHVGPLPGLGKTALEATRDAARTARGQASLRLRRFLRGALRLHPGRLLAIAQGTSSPGPAVRSLMAKNPRLEWQVLGTASSFARVLEGWLTFDGGRAFLDPTFVRADGGAVLSWLAAPEDGGNGPRGTAQVPGFVLPMADG